LTYDEPARIWPQEKKMPREIKTHHDGLGLNDLISITADELGAGNASHTYRLNIEGGAESVIVFQHGPRNETGSTAGVTDQAVLSVLIDRMKCFNAGPYGCRENALALTKMEEALHWMRARAEERRSRGVLGKNEK